ncbi:uncharacterized protein LOC125662889 [Ostrea edulis]|uniref:uncharacterized protein LOC125662889 n=1 Tax=Ostrea edulis TaxID=37623 RepID=UPI0024AFED38|nr:uncharacterized protein LOC125662889 [Ostrea edulis]
MYTPYPRYLFVDGYNSWTPSAMPLLAATLVIALTPTESNAGSTCTAPGYAINPVLGCIKLYTFRSPAATISVMAAQCASDGGELLLVNSEAENTALVNFMISDSNGVFSVGIQGSRVTVTDPWLTDAGEPLPYIGNIPGTSNIAGLTRLMARFDNTWFSLNSAFLLDQCVCEIL